MGEAVLTVDSKRPDLFRRPWLWIALFLLSIGATLFSLRYFSRAFPLVSLDLRMDRREALLGARQLADKWDFGPKGFRQAASFRLDSTTQSFVELEAGGKDAFARLLAEGLYSPYTWQVRHFRPEETRETLVRFTPQGGPYGFLERFPESEPGASLPGNAARTLAEAAARDSWNIDLAPYELVEASQEIQSGGRVDHTFVYDRQDARLGEGRYRLRLVVSGDRLSEVTHFVRVPEAFSRRYEEMRSANETVAAVAGLATGLLYLIGGVGFGLFFLLRARWVIWKTPLVLGAAVAFLQLLAGLNQWPLLWMDYDTALASSDFVIQTLISLLLQFVAMSVVFALSFSAAESLTRRAFPGHPQLWRLGSRGVRASRQVLGRTVAGYLLVSLFFAYEVALYFVTTRWLGWWTPSDALFHPDVLANYYPWFSAIALSLQAGFWEECLFRAVPLAGAALLGQRLGRRRELLVAAFVLQAIVFGAAHANYPNQPAYARLVELVLPSFAFGGLYLAFGLLPAIVLHFAFDVVWFALPLFVAATPGIVVDRALVILLTLAPLWMALYARLRSGGFTELDAEDRNAGWAPSQPEPSPPPAAIDSAPASETWRGIMRWGPAAGIAGLALWALFGEFSTPAPPLPFGRDQAIAVARQALAGRGIEIEPSWKTLSFVEASPDQEHRFVWQTGGRASYAALMGTYLTPPQWVVRFARFEGDVAERAEEYLVFVHQHGQPGHSGERPRLRHRLPEARAGASISEEQARKLARAAVEEQFGLPPPGLNDLKEVSAVPAKHPSRVDWVFTFAERENRWLSSGEARLIAAIAGDEVVDAYRHVHLPEEWERAERQRRTLPRAVQMVSTILLALVLLAGVASALVAWSRGHYRPRVFVAVFLLLLALGAIDLANAWPSIQAGLSTERPVSHQVLVRIASGLFVVLSTSAGLALISGFLHSSRPAASLESPDALSLGCSLGALAAALAALSEAWTPSLVPAWPDYEPAGAMFPPLAGALRPLRGQIVATTVMLLLMCAAQRLSAGGTRRKAWLALGLMVAGWMLAGVGPVASLPAWLASGGILGVALTLAYLALLRFDFTVIPLAVGVMSLLAELKQALYRAYPGWLAAGALALGLVAVLSYVWFRALRRPTRGS